MDSISQINKIYKEAHTVEEWNAFIEAFSGDERSGLIKLVGSSRKQIAAYEIEVQRTEALKVYEKKYEDLGYICGIDEVGRGPLAGPIVSAAVVLPKDFRIPYVNDSKKLTVMFAVVCNCYS